MAHILYQKILWRVGTRLILVPKCEPTSHENISTLPWWFSNVFHNFSFNPKTRKTLHRNHLPLNAGEACILGENPQKIAIPTYLEAKKVRNRFSSLSWIDPRNSGLKWSIFDEVMLPKLLRNFFGPFFFWLWFENFVATWWKNRWQNEVTNCVTMLFSLNPN